MSLARSTILALLAAAAVFAAAAYGLTGLYSDGTDNAYVRADVTPVSVKVPGLVASVLVEDNQQVSAGDVLFRLDDRDYQARTGEARALLDARRAALTALESRLALQRSAIDRARASLAGAKAEADRAGLQLERVGALRAAGWATKASGDEAIAQSRSALAELQETGAALTASTSEMAVIESQRPQLLADVRAAEAMLRLAEIDLESTVVRAPADGRVAERQARTGQYVRPGTQLIALVSGRAWVVANFKETQLRGLRPGDGVQVSIDALPGQAFAGEVESLSPASGAQFALLPPDNATGNFTRVVQRIPIRISLRAGQPRLAELRPGMSARVRRLAKAR